MVNLPQKNQKQAPLIQQPLAVQAMLIVGCVLDTLPTHKEPSSTFTGTNSISDIALPFNLLICTVLLDGVRVLKKCFPSSLSLMHRGLSPNSLPRHFDSAQTAAAPSQRSTVTAGACWRT